MPDTTQPEKPPDPHKRYGFIFTSANRVLQELWMIANKKGDPFTHYRELEHLLWPEYDQHRWSDLCLKTMVENTMTVLMGPANSNKTSSAARFALMDYWAFPTQTTILMSSTDMRGLKLRVWGEVKKLFGMATERWDCLAGTVLEGQMAIATDNLEKDGAVRDLRNALIAIPCMISGRVVGLGKYVGIKNKRVRLISDELALMGPSWLDSVANLRSNPDFKMIGLGNPIDPTDQLGKAAEPADGWSSIGEPTKTTVWKTRFLDGVCVNLVGSDSPNFDEGLNPRRPKYRYLTHQKHFDEVMSFWGKDSLQYYSQCVGVMKSMVLGRRVLTREIALKHHALEDAVWRGTERTRVYAVDLAWGGVGGDRAVGIWGEFGLDENGKQILRLDRPVLIPVTVSKSEPPEDQIASWLQEQLKELRIPPENCAYDSTGRGSIGSAFARYFGHVTPVPVEFGGRPSEGPVRGDLYIYDEKDKCRRLKKCSEHYSKRVSQYWFAVRYAVESDQIREMSDDVLTEFCQREWGLRAGNKIEIESKSDTKERMGRSPDLADAACVLVEIAIQRGFVIQKLGQSVDGDYQRESFLDSMAEKWDKVEQSKRLQLTH